MQVVRDTSTILATLVVAGVVAAILFYAAVGVACLHMTAPAITNETECYKVQRIENKLWCMSLHDKYE